MRLLWPEATKFYLNGEIDKSAHPILRKLGTDHVKPDLLVHHPGYMTGNHAVIEVKSSGASLQGIRKDLQNLALFRDRVGYERAICLIYGCQAAQVVDRVLRVTEELGGYLTSSCGSSRPLDNPPPITVRSSGPPKAPSAEFHIECRL